MQQAQDATMGTGRVMLRATCFSGLVLPAFCLLGFGIFTCHNETDEKASDMTTGIFMICLASVYIVFMSIVFMCCCCGPDMSDVMPDNLHVVQVGPGPNTLPQNTQRCESESRDKVLTIEVDRAPSVIGIDDDHVVIVVENPK